MISGISPHIAVQLITHQVDQRTSCNATGDKEGPLLYFAQDGRGHRHRRCHGNGRDACVSAEQREKTGKTEQTDTQHRTEEKKSRLGIWEILVNPSQSRLHVNILLYRFGRFSCFSRFGRILNVAVRSFFYLANRTAVIHTED